MKKVKAILLLVLILILVVVIGAAGFIWWAFTPSVSGIKYCTTVTVLEGSIDLFDPATRNFLKTLYKGESTEIVGSIAKLPPVFETIKPLFLKVSALVLNELNALAVEKGMPDTFSVFYPERQGEELLYRVIDSKTNGKVQLKYIKISETGAEVSALINVMGISSTVSGSGMISADAMGTGQLRLNINWLKFNQISVPEFILRDFEQSFNESQSLKLYLIKINSIKYFFGGVEVSGSRSS